MSRPRIGLSTYRELASFGVWSEPADLLPATYVKAIDDAGGLAMLIPPPYEGLEEAAETVLDGLHGVLLTGGADVDPARYGAERQELTDKPRTDRDAWEIALVHAALRREMPLLGVCRGMQVMAVALGGSLIQHVPDAVGTLDHCPTVGVHGRHGVTLTAGSRIAGLVGTETEVATYHHQAVDRLPDDATATGWSDDGTVEAFEIGTAAWALGVQWHPEVHDGGSLFRGFVAACAEWSR